MINNTFQELSKEKENNITVITELTATLNEKQ